MTLLNKYNSFLTQFIQFQLRADTSGTDVNFIIVLKAVQLDLHAVNTINWNRDYLQCSQYNV